MKGGQTLSQQFVQILIPNIISGVGFIFAGALLVWLQTWELFKSTSVLDILVVSLLGLKGNLEMTMASRICTQVNLGNFQQPKRRWEIICANMALVQVQAIPLGFVASVAALFLGYCVDGPMDPIRCLFIITASMLTTSFSSFLIGVLIILLIMVSRRFNINPDNIAIPVASCVGDLLTLLILSGSAWVFNGESRVLTICICPVVITLLVASTFYWHRIAKREETTEVVLHKGGWTPIIIALLFSSISGLILKLSVNSLKGFALLSPIMSGMGGNLAAIFSSSMSTSLYSSNAAFGILPASLAENTPWNPVNLFRRRDGDEHSHWKLAIILSIQSLFSPIFAVAATIVSPQENVINWLFIVLYSIGSEMLTVFLLYVSKLLVTYLWVNQIDPDSAVIPYLSSIGDLLGNMLLATILYIVKLVK